MSELDHEWVTTQEVADHFRISVVSVFRWVKAGRLPAYKVGGVTRYRRVEVEGLAVLKGHSYPWELEEPATAEGPPEATEAPFLTQGRHK